MPIFSLLILGSAEFGILAYDAVEVTNAAFAGASYGSQSHETAADTANIQLAATTDAADVSGMSAAVAHTCGCSNGTTISTITCSTAATSCVSPSHIIEYVQVTTSATVNPIALYKGSPTSFTLTGKSILVVQK